MTRHSPTPMATIDRVIISQDDNGNAIERKAELSAAGAFDEFTNGKIFEDKNRGMLA